MRCVGSSGQNVFRQNGMQAELEWMCVRRARRDECVLPSAERGRMYAILSSFSADSNSHSRRTHRNVSVDAMKFEEIRAERR